MKKNISAFIVFFIGITSLLSLTSCEKDDPYTSPLIGSWTAYENNYGSIYPADRAYERYSFYTDGTGTYEYKDNYNQLRSTGFRWTSMNENWIQLTYNDGAITSAYYRFNGNNYLTFSQDQTFRTYTTYRYSM